jgi:predicted helicase
VPPVDLRTIKTFPQLVKYLRDELDWPIESTDFEELTFDYSADELGLDSRTAAKIKEIKQLRPLESKQPWGIFFVNFQPQRLPVVALRRILRSLVVKKRQSATKAQQATWHLHDLLFISSYGESDHRDITFAHFSEEAEHSNLPVLRVLGWDDEDTALHTDYTGKMLRERLCWPKDTRDIAKWQSTWSSAFTLKHLQVVRTSKELALSLADLAQKIRKRAKTVLALENDKGPLRKLQAAFKEALIHDLTDDDFADMYAQTISYGLLTARISRPSGLVADNLKDMVPVTNPFLKELLETFLNVGGRKGKIDFDELGISEVVELLRDADMEAVLRDFGDRNPDEDPAIHFYELFLKEYDPQKRIKRGVFYTPKPVVSFIVRSAHELLQKDFGLIDGLADTSTWQEVADRLKVAIPDGASPSAPFVTILDPATGTGTFLVEAIELIHETMKKKWLKYGHMELEIPHLWNQYVPSKLLPRIYGYELLMAPYAIAHMKIGLKLYEKGYRFASDERARIFLTNSLEPAGDDQKQREFEEWAPALAHEARAVNSVKRQQRFSVIFGNPPYSKMSGNLGQYAIDLIEPFRFVDGAKVIEKGALAFELNLQDDYVKFWALAMSTIRTTGVGIAGFISNSRYLASPSLRGMRRNLQNNFNAAVFLNLGGQVSELRTGEQDENVFEIEQGVAVGIFVSNKNRCDMSAVRYESLTGSRIEKYKFLDRFTGKHPSTQVTLAPPFYRFSRGIDDAEEQFSSWDELSEIMPFNSGCIITSRDNLAIDLDQAVLLKKVNRFANSARGDKTIEEEIGFSAKAKWDVEACKAEIRNDTNQSSRVKKILYRPFDSRWIYYSTKLLDTPSKPVCDSIFDHQNLILLTPRVKTTETFCHVLISRLAAEKKSCSHDRATQMFPLYRYETGLLEGKKVNISSSFFARISAVAGSSTDDNRIPAYIYGILHSPEYRRLYGNALRDSYPRIPVPRQAGLYEAITEFGQELFSLHLLEAQRLSGGSDQYRGTANPEVEKVFYKDSTVWLDSSKGCGFIGVPEAVWSFYVGGYQVCEKWLKDRKGRTLSKDDINHYQRIVVAISETIRIMTEIDKVIDAHGGWPGAFATAAKAAEGAAT